MFRCIEIDMQQDYIVIWKAPGGRDAHVPRVLVSVKANTFLGCIATRQPGHCFMSIDAQLNIQSDAYHVCAGLPLPGLHSAARWV